jgi:hypothetical protein
MVILEEGLALLRMGSARMEDLTLFAFEEFRMAAMISEAP